MREYYEHHATYTERLRVDVGMDSNPISSHVKC